eukprot:Skav208170  [mRNA]  locus=scaffold1044:278502:288516:+ [translate_table: standard]
MQVKTASDPSLARPPVRRKASNVSEASDCLPGVKLQQKNLPEVSLPSQEPSALVGFDLMAALPAVHRNSFAFL